MPTIYLSDVMSAIDEAENASRYDVMCGCGHTALYHDDRRRERVTASRTESRMRERYAEAWRAVESGRYASVIRDFYNGSAEAFVEDTYSDMSFKF